MVHKLWIRENLRIQTGNKNPCQSRSICGRKCTLLEKSRPVLVHSIDHFHLCRNFADHLHFLLCLDPDHALLQVTIPTRTSLMVVDHGAIDRIFQRNRQQE